MTVRSLAEHRTAVAAALREIAPLDVLIGDAAGALLAEDLVAAHAMPATAVAAVDGYAVRAESVASASPSSPVTLPVSHDVPFDARGPRRLVDGTAARLSSGVAVPSGADAVVPVTHTDAGVAKVGIMARVTEGENVRPAGFDAAEGDVVVPAGTRLGPRQIAAAAALDRPRLLVRPVPRVVVIAVGTELMEPGQQRHGGGIPEANAHMLAEAVRDAGAEAYRVGVVPDDRLELRSVIEDQLVRADVVLTTGGLSAARNDTVADVLRGLGDVEISGLAMEPGRRHGLGSLPAGGGRDVPVIALPGHPVAAFIAFEAYVRPALRAMAGFQDAERRTVTATSAKAWDSPEGHVQVVPVMLKGDGPTATPAGDPAAPSLTDVVGCDALCFVDAATTRVGRGDEVTCSVWES